MCFAFGHHFAASRDDFGGVLAVNAGTSVWQHVPSSTATEVVVLSPPISFQPPSSLFPILVDVPSIFGSSNFQILVQK